LADASGLGGDSHSVGCVSADGLTVLVVVLVVVAVVAIITIIIVFVVVVVVALHVLPLLLVVVITIVVVVRCVRGDRLGGGGSPRSVNRVTLLHCVSVSDHTTTGVACTSTLIL
jgi:hypothetical protein